MRLKQLERLIFFISFLFVFSSCANYKLNYAPEVKDWEKAIPQKDSEVQHSIYLIGDGAPKTESLYGAEENIKILHGFYPQAQAVGDLVQAKFDSGSFEDVAYFEPDYLKEYRTTIAKQKL